MLNQSEILNVFTVNNNIITKTKPFVIQNYDDDNFEMQLKEILTQNNYRKIDHPTFEYGDITIEIYKQDDTDHLLLDVFYDRVSVYFYIFTNIHEMLFFINNLLSNVKSIYSICEV